AGKPVALFGDRVDDGVPEVGDTDLIEAAGGDGVAEPRAVQLERERATVSHEPRVGRLEHLVCRVTEVEGFESAARPLKEGRAAHRVRLCAAGYSCTASITGSTLQERSARSS